MARQINDSMRLSSISRSFNFSGCIPGPGLSADKLESYENYLKEVFTLNKAKKLPFSKKYGPTWDNDITNRQLNEECKYLVSVILSMHRFIGHTRRCERAGTQRISI